MNMKRMRGRNHRPNGGGGSGGGGFRNQQNGIPLNRNHVFDSSGPEMRLRGTAQQLHEKYTQLARDASSSGDRVTGEAYYQHAEHYFRIISAINQAAGQNGQTAPQPQTHNGYQNSQNEYQNRRPHHPNGNAPQGGGQNGNAPNGHFFQEPQEAPEPRGYEQRESEPRQEAPFERRPDRQRQAYRETAPEQVIDRRIDISSALEAELAAAVEQPGLGEQPSLNIPLPMPERTPDARAIPISATPPEDVAAPAAPVIRPRAPRGRPRAVKPEAITE